VSIKTIHSTLLATGFTLTVAGVALARQPPALSAVQEHSARAVACEGGKPATSPGYREAAVRFGTRVTASSVEVAGYRGKFVRSGVAAGTEHVACTPTGPRLSASR
jgi:hypothetical protein